MREPKMKQEEGGLQNCKSITLDEAHEKWILLPKSIFDDPIFCEEPFGKIDALLWMSSQAFESDGATVTSAGTISVQKGQLVFHVDYMARKWQWANSDVRSYLDQLQHHGLILVNEIDSNPQYKRITIIDFQTPDDISKMIDFTQKDKRN